MKSDEPKSDPCTSRGDADIAIDDIIDLLFGPLTFRHMTGHYPLTEDHARRLTEVALRGALAPNAPRTG